MRGLGRREGAAERTFPPSLRLFPTRRLTLKENREALKSLLGVCRRVGQVDISSGFAAWRGEGHGE